MIRVLFFSCLLLSLSSQTCFANEGTAKTEKYRIGVILPFVGAVADAAVACKNGTVFAHEHLKKETAERLEIVYEDDQNISKNTISAFKKLSHGDKKVDAVLTFSSGTSKAVAPLADRTKVPLLAIASDPEVVKNRTHVVNFWVTPEEQTKILFKEVTRREYKRIARITTIHDGTLAIKNVFDALNKDTTKVVLDEEYQQDTKDFRPFLNKIKRAGQVDAIFVNLYFGAPGLFARQARELGITAPLFNVESFEDPAQVEAAQGALTGAWYVQADDPSGTFLKEYQARFPGASTYTSGNCHDVVKLVGAALENNVPATELNGYIHSVKDFTGALGTFSSTEDNRYSLPATVKIVTESGFEKFVAK